MAAKRTPPNTSRNKSSNTQRAENKMTDVVIHQHSRKPLKMDILMSETCWAHNKWNKIASDIKMVFHSSTLEIFEWYRVAPEIRKWPCLQIFSKELIINHCIIWGSALWLLPISINCKQTDKTRRILPPLIERARHRLKKTLFHFQRFSQNFVWMLCHSWPPWRLTVYFPKIRSTNKMGARTYQAGAPPAGGSSNDVCSVMRLTTIRKFEIMSDTLDVHGICASIIRSSQA